MTISFMGILLFLCAIMMGYFAFRRFTEYRLDKTNTIKYHYFLAATSISMGFAFYGLPSIIFGNNGRMIALGAIIATILNAAGFMQFFLIPLYSWLTPKNFIVAKYVLWLYVTAIAGFFIIAPPHSYLDSYGIIHWRLQVWGAWTMFFLIGAAFVLNITLVWRNLKKLQTFSCLNTIAVILTFLAAGLGGGYLYVGDKTALLFIATILLYIGMSIIFFASVRMSLKPRWGEKSPPWQERG